MSCFKDLIILFSSTPYSSFVILPFNFYFFIVEYRKIKTVTFFILMLIDFSALNILSISAFS